VCAAPNVFEAIEAINDHGDPTNLIDIDELAYDYDGTEDDLPVIEFATTIRSDAADPAALPWRLQTIRSTKDLTLENLALKSGDVSQPAGSGEISFHFSAVDVVGANLVGTNLSFEAGFHNVGVGQIPEGRPNSTLAVYVRNGDVTLTDIAAGPWLDFYSGGVFLDDGSAVEHHDLVIADSTFTGTQGLRNYAIGGVVEASYAASATVTNTTFDKVSQYAIGATVESLTVADCDFDALMSSNYVGGVHFTGWSQDDDNAQLTISDSTFTGHAWNNYGGYGDGAVRIDAYYSYVDAVIEHSAFSGNYSSIGGADVNFEGYGRSTLEVVDSTFDAFRGYSSGGSFEIYGGTHSYRESSWNGTGAEGYNGYYGGAIYSGGTDLSLDECSFDSTTSYSDGGALYLTSGEGAPSRARITDTTFTSTTSMNGSGGAIAAGEGDYEFLRTSFTGSSAPAYGGAVYLPWDNNQTWSSFTDVSFTDTAAYAFGGGAVSATGTQHMEMDGVSFTNVISFGLYGPNQVGLGYYGGEGGAVRLENESPWPSDYPLGASYQYGGENGVTLVAKDLTVDGAVANAGGAFFLEGPGHTLSVSDSSFTGTGGVPPEVTETTTGVSNPVAVFGGLIYADPGNRIEFHSINVLESVAYFGGAIFSRSFDWREDYYYNEFGGQGSDMPPCFEYSAYPRYDGPEYGSEWIIDGVSFADGLAGAGASVAFFGRHDTVSMTGSTITGNESLGRATIVANNATRIDLSCNTFCGNEVVAGASGIEMYDDGMYPEFRHWDYYYGGEQKDVRYELNNNVFQDGASDDLDLGSAVLVRTCPSYEGNYYYAESSPYYGGEFRGHVKIRNNTFVGNFGGEGNVLTHTNDTRLEVTNNLFQDGDIGLHIGDDTTYVEASYNLYGDTTIDVIDEPGFGFDEPDATNLTEPAVFRNYTPGTCGGELYLAPGSPGVDAGYPDESWNDNFPADPLAPSVPNRGDIGAFGGPDACVPDVDCDTQNAILDCDDLSLGTYVGAPEVPYDGIDQDCDGADLCDLDGDGVDAAFAGCGGTDCNDLDAAIHPGATDILENGIDEDCEGGDEVQAEENTNLFVDADGDGHPSTATGGHDCDDANGTINPSAEEVPYDGVDQDCADGDLVDVDCDGFAADASNFPNGQCPEGLTCDDCDDDEASVYPGASDNPLDEIDQDCDGTPAEMWAQGGCGCATPAPAPVGGMFGLFAAALAFVRRRGQR